MNSETTTCETNRPIEQEPTSGDRPYSNARLLTANGREQAFLLYTLFCGDVVKTAQAVGCENLEIVALAKKGGWDEKISDILRLRKSNKPGDLERAINRAINYVQAHRYRAQIERVISYFHNLQPRDLAELLVSEVTDKLGVTKRSVSCRAFADLSSAMEKAHAMTYLALGDTSSDRARRKEDEEAGVVAATAMHQQIAQAMQSVALESSTGLLEGEQAKLADDIKTAEAPLDPPKPPPKHTPESEPTPNVEIPPL